MTGSSQGALPDGAAGITLPANCRTAAGKPTGTGDDTLLAAMYMRMWALASGRPLPRDVPPGELTEEELVSFWADDFRQPTGRHEATAGGRR
jgi:hypothetical protein